MTTETLPQTYEEALQMMRFGCPLEQPLGEFDVKYFERRMLRAAEIIELKVDDIEESLLHKIRRCHALENRLWDLTP